MTNPCLVSDGRLSLDRYANDFSAADDIGTTSPEGVVIGTNLAADGCQPARSFRIGQMGTCESSTRPLRYQSETIPN